MEGNDGLENLDVGVLTAEQQEKLRQFKIKTRIDNEKYLRSHPEVEELIGGFMRNVLLKRPNDIREFAAKADFGGDIGRYEAASSMLSIKQTSKDYFNNLNLLTGHEKEGNSDKE